MGWKDRAGGCRSCAQCSAPDRPAVSARWLEQLPCASLTVVTSCDHAQAFFSRRSRHDGRTPLSLLCRGRRAGPADLRGRRPHHLPQAVRCRLPGRPGRSPLGAPHRHSGHPRHDHRPQRRAPGGFHRGGDHLVQSGRDAGQRRPAGAPGPGHPQTGSRTAQPDPRPSGKALPLPGPRPVAHRWREHHGPRRARGAADQGIQALLSQLRPGGPGDRHGQHRRPWPGGPGTGLRGLAGRPRRCARGADQSARLGGQEHPRGAPAATEQGRRPVHRPAPAIHRLSRAAERGGEVRRPVRIGRAGQSQDRPDPGDDQLSLLQPQQPRHPADPQHAQPHPDRRLRARFGDQAVQHVGGPGLGQVQREQYRGRGAGLDDHRRSHHPRRGQTRRADHDRGAAQLLQHRHEQGGPADRPTAHLRAAQPGRLRQSAGPGFSRRERRLPAWPHQVVADRHGQYVLWLQPGGQRRRTGPGLFGDRQRRHAHPPDPAQGPEAAERPGHGPVHRPASACHAQPCGGRRRWRIPCPGARLPRGRQVGYRAQGRLRQLHRARLSFAVRRHGTGGRSQAGAGSDAG